MATTTTEHNENRWALVRRGPAPLAFLLVLGMLLATAAAAAQLNSGVAGVVLAGQPCRDVKVCRGQGNVVIRVFEAPSGDRVATVRTSPQGRFRVPLPAGRYVLRVTFAQPDRAPLKSSQGVRVQPNRFTLVIIRLAAGSPRPTRVTRG